jgi:predicted permease
MTWAKELWNRLRHLGRRGDFDADLSEEIRIHLEMRADELEAEGLSRKDAQLRARREFGPAARAQEDSRRAWRFQWFEDLLSDLRYAGRAFLRSPGFAAAGIFSLALGTGANTTMFTLTNQILINRPSAANPERIVTMRIGGRSHAEQKEFRIVRDSGMFDGVAGMREEAEVNWRIGSETRRLKVVRVTDNFFDVTGTPVLLGRGIATGETNAVVLHHTFWKGSLNGDPEAVGKTLVLDGHPFTIAGVLPQDHHTLVGFGFAPELYVPVTDERELVKLVVRLPQGMSPPQALERLKAVCARIDQIYPPPGEPRARYAAVDEVTGTGWLRSRKMMPFIAFFAMLMVVAGLVLLVACANVASLHLARAVSRRQELSVRLALGAGRGRVIRQLLAESLLMAGLGTAAGLGLTILLTGLLDGLPIPLPIPVRLSLQPDWPLFGYSLVVAVGAALVSGVMPAFAATRSGVAGGLKSEERSVGGGAWSLRNVVVAAQLAVTAVLLVTGLLFLRNLAQASTMNPGFDADHTIWATLRLVPERYPTRERIAAVTDRVLDAVRSEPGVTSAAVAEVIPLNDGRTIGTTMRTDLDAQGQPIRAQMNVVSPGYFRTMGIALLDGRDFNTSDRQTSEDVVILNVNMARRLFHERSPLGHTISWNLERGQTVLRVVGVVQGSKFQTLGEDEQPAMYQPLEQRGSGSATIHVLARTDRAPEAVAHEIRGMLLQLDETAAVESRPMKSALAFAFLPSRAGAALLGSMGGLGLLLASLGLYGVLAYAVSRRVREIGLRMALGATPGTVLRMILRQSLLLICIGAGAGLLVALLVTQPLSMFLVPGLSPTDAVSYAAVAVLLTVLGAAASAGPALRAVRIDPATALRYE